MWHNANGQVACMAAALKRKPIKWANPSSIMWNLAENEVDVFCHGQIDNLTLL